MSLFNFGNLIQPEKDVLELKPKTLVKDHASLRALVKEAVEKQKQEAAPIAKSEPTPELTLAESKMQLPVVEEKLEVSRTKVLEELTPEDQKTEEVIENNTTGTFFLKTMLSEFSDLLDAGKALDQLNDQKKELGLEQTVLEEEEAIEKTRKGDIAKNLSLMLTEESESSEYLEKALESYNQYLNHIEEKFDRRKAALSGVSEQIQTQIESKKKQISALIEYFGGGNTEKGKEIFEDLKKVVSFCKRQRMETTQKNANISETIRNDVSNFTTRFVENDMHGAVMLAQNNDLIGIMMRVFQKPGADLTTREEN